jgi:hypothetical protein
MKALSLWQPWASAIPAGLKTIETRGWYTNYRGPLAIHAARKRDGDVIDFWSSIDDGEKAKFSAIGIHQFNDLPFGAIIATCHLIDCRKTETLNGEVSGDDQEWGNFSPGRFGWILSDIRKIDPVFVRGAQGLWNWNPA